MAEAIVSMVVGRITDLLKEEPLLLQQVKDEIQQVVTELMRIKTFLPDADSRIDEEKIRNLLREVREIAYDAEHVVESFLVKWMNMKKFSIKVNDIQGKMSLLFSSFLDYKIKSTSEAADSSNSLNGTSGKLKRFHSFTTVEPEIFVGFQGDVDLLVGHLVNESDNYYPLVSICGMGGLGKTTLAEKIYNHPTIKASFAGLAWVSVSQKWEKKQVLQRILEKKRCLIVLDDIWTDDVWDSLKAGFSAGRSICKLILTSRNVEVAEHVNPKGFIHQPECLGPDHSWELLRLKALPRGYYLVVPVLKVDRTGLAGGCVHCSGVTPPRTPLSDVSNVPSLCREQVSLGVSRFKASLQVPNILTDENGQCRSSVRHERVALRSHHVNLESEINFDDDVPLSVVLTGLRTDRVRLKGLKRKGVFVVDEVNKKLDFGPADLEKPPHNSVRYEDIENSTILGHDYNDEIFFSEDDCDDNEFSEPSDELKSRYDKNFAQGLY
ncbi:hypothetical protein ACET3Z_004701 [Daucus carota]